jgi:carbon-monoxide dehydrogenase medium subunit
MLPPIEILNTTTVAEATGELARLGDRARVYGGGTELLVLLRHGLVRPDYLLNIKTIAGLEEIHRRGDVLSIGATVTHRRLETEPSVREFLPMLSSAESQVANVRVRNQGTLGGNLSFNDPHSDPATVLLVHEASARIAGARGERLVPLDQFLIGMYATALEPDELLLGVEVPRLPAGFAGEYLRIHRLQRPTLGVAVAAKMRNGNIEEARLAVGCVGPKAQRLRELESKLRGAGLQDASRIVKAAKPYLRELLDPSDDLLGSAEYKVYLSAVLLDRGLIRAANGAGRN